MNAMRRNAKWIALVVVIGMVLPFVSQALAALLLMDTLDVALILVLITVAVLTWLTLGRRNGDSDDSSA